MNNVRMIRPFGVYNFFFLKKRLYLVYLLLKNKSAHANTDNEMGLEFEIYNWGIMISFFAYH